MESVFRALLFSGPVRCGQRQCGDCPKAGRCEWPSTVSSAALSEDVQQVRCHIRFHLYFQLITACRSPTGGHGDLQWWYSQAAWLVKDSSSSSRTRVSSPVSGPEGQREQVKGLVPSEDPASLWLWLLPARSWVAAAESPRLQSLECLPPRPSHTGR